MTSSLSDLIRLASVNASGTAPLITVPYLKSLIKTVVSDPTGYGTASPAARILESQVRELSNKWSLVEPYPVRDLFSWLEDSGVPQDELKALRKVRLPRVKKRQGMTFPDALGLFTKITGKPVVLSGVDSGDDSLAPRIVEWAKAIKGLKGSCLRLWNSRVRKVRLVPPRGMSEDASWESPDVVLALRPGKVLTKRQFICHEMGHALEDKLHLVVTPWDDTPYGNPPFISDYAKTNAAEDFAETFAHILTEPSRVRSKTPAKYRDMIERLKGNSSKKLARGNSWEDVVFTLQWKQGTKSKAEKEDEEVERLIRPLPKKNPPRNDLRRERIREEDPDFDDEAKASKDKDLSRNYKRIGHAGPYRVASRYMLSSRYQNAASDPHRPGDVWKSDSGKWVGLNPDGNAQAFSEDKEGKDKAHAWAIGRKLPKDEGGDREEKSNEPDGAPDGGDNPQEGPAKRSEDSESFEDTLDFFKEEFAGDPHMQETIDELIEFERRERARRGPSGEEGPQSIKDLFRDLGDLVEDPDLADKIIREEGKDDKGSAGDVSKAIQEMAGDVRKKEKSRANSQVKKVLDSLQVFSEGGVWRQPDLLVDVQEMLDKMSPEDKLDFASEFQARMMELSKPRTGGFSKQELRQADKAIGTPLGDVGLSATLRGRALAQAVFTKTRLVNPRWAGGSEIKRGHRASEEELEQRASNAFNQFLEVSSEMRQEVANHLGADLEMLPQDAPEREEIERVGDALALVAAARGESLEINAEVIKRDRDGNPVYDRDKISKAEKALVEAEKALKEHGSSDDDPSLKDAVQEAKRDLKEAQSTPLTEKVTGMLRPEPTESFQGLARLALEKGNAGNLLQGMGNPGSPEHRAGIRETMEGLFLDPDDGLEKLQEFWSGQSDTWGDGWGEMANWVSEIRETAANGDPSDPETRDAQKKLETAAWAQQVLTRWGVTALSTGDALLNGPPGINPKKSKEIRSALKKVLPKSEHLVDAMDSMREIAEKARTPEELAEYENQGGLSILRAIRESGEKVFGFLDPGRPVVAQVQVAIANQDMSELDKPYIRQGGEPGQRESPHPPMPTRHRPGDVWRTEDGFWSAKSPKGLIKNWPGDDPRAKEKAENFSKEPSVGFLPKTSSVFEIQGRRLRLLWGPFLNAD